MQGRKIKALRSAERRALKKFRCYRTLADKSSSRVYENLREDARQELCDARTALRRAVS